MQQEDVATSEALTDLDRQRAFGEKLKKLRLERDVSIDMLAQVTRINPHYIESLESGMFRQIPGTVFARGFVANYLKHFGITDQVMLQEFDQAWDRPEASSVLKVQIKSRPVRLPSDEWLKVVSTVKSLAYRGVFTKAAILFICIVSASYWGAGKWNHIQSQKKTAEKKVTVVQVTPVLPAPAIPSEELAPPEKPAGREVSVTSQDGSEQVLAVEVLEKVRLKIDADGGQKSAEEYQPGIYQFKFSSKLNLMVYDAGAVKITFNGKSLGVLGNKGRVRRLSFEAETPKTNKM